jgi:chemotaxis protein MotB
MAGKRDKKGSGRPIIIVKNEIVEGGHHGGAWKVAYADFVTAMMAFFLLMWLLNATTEDQRKGLADYFAPSNLMSHASSGTGQPFGGHTAFDEGAMVSDRGAVEIADGKRPPVEAAEDSDANAIGRTQKSGTTEKSGMKEKPGSSETSDRMATNPDPAVADPSFIGQGGRVDKLGQDGSREPTAGANRSGEDASGKGGVREGGRRNPIGGSQ